MVLSFLGCGDNMHSLNGKQFAADEILEGEVKIYIQIIFISETECEFYRTQYSSFYPEDKWYDFQNVKKIFNYSIEEGFLVLKKINDSDVVYKLEILDKSLHFHYGNASEGRNGQKIISLNEVS
jgi:hypothetical protein